MSKLKKWLQQGNGGEWYEPYVTNGDLIKIAFLTLFVSLILIIGINFS